MNEPERITTEICSHSFLSFWTFANPVSEDNGEELTDVLAVSSPFVILFSVKDIDIAPIADLQVQSQRWLKRAIEKSYKQLYGAERVITNRLSRILTNDRKHVIPFPVPAESILYRVGVSVGRRPGFALPFGNFETGFVHFFDQHSFPRILHELDTITDFVDYLEAKQRLFDGSKIARFRSEEDLLAVYLHNGRRFPFDAGITQIQSLAWDELQRKPGFMKRKEQEKKSYIWDGIIEEFFRDASEGGLIFGAGMAETEQALRAMSRETRFSRMALSDSIVDFVGFYRKRDEQLRARMSRAQSGVVYVFVLDEHRENDRMQRIHELELRCFVARGHFRDATEVVGIATNPYQKGAGHSYDLYYLRLPELTAEQTDKITNMQRDTGFFVNARAHENHYDEYPT